MTHRLAYDGLSNDAESVLSRLAPIEREVQDQEGCWYLARLLPYRSTEDRIEGVVITFIDIDTRKKAEEAVRASEQRLRRMVNVDGVGVLIFNRSGALIDCNEAFLKTSGFSREEIAAGKLTWRSLTPLEYVDVTEQQRRKLAELGRVGLYEKEYFRKDGSRDWMVVASASLGDGSLIEYCFDVSGRKRAEAQVIEREHTLQIADAALVRANTDLKHFSYAVSHDMQEPLRMVMSYTQLLARDYRGKLDPQADLFIANAVEGAKRMEALLNDLREYWSVDEQKVEEVVPIDCNQVLSRVLEYLERTIEESHAVVTHDALPGVLAEHYPLTLLFQNVIGNAIKYRRPETPPRVHVSSNRSGSAWTFSVADNGIGIEGEYLDVIFTPFKRLHSAEVPGTGLGLAMCQKIVQRYHGRIWATSTPGEGSTFKFTLPALDGSG